MIPPITYDEILLLLNSIQDYRRNTGRPTRAATLDAAHFILRASKPHSMTLFPLTRNNVFEQVLCKYCLPVTPELMRFYKT